MASRGLRPPAALVILGAGAGALAIYYYYLIERRRQASQKLTPRLRLIRHLEKIISLLDTHEVDEIRSLPPEQRSTLQVANTISWQAKKCRHFDACLACTLNPCACSRFTPLRLSHRLYVVQHPKEVMRTTATGKLLLLAHPHATLLVSGVASDDAELARICRRPTAVVLYPSASAVTPAELLKRHGGAAGATCSGAADDTALDIIVLDGTWQQARSMYRQIPESVATVAVDLSQHRSSFGTRVRRQGAWREEHGRVSTLEAYAHLALALGDEASVVDTLGQYLETFIGALPYSREPVAAAGADEEKTSRSTKEEEERPELPARTPTNLLRRRARGLKNKLLVDGKTPQWSRPGRELLADFLESKPQLAGVPLGWRVEAQTASLVVEAEDKAEVAASWPLSQLIAEEGAAGCKDVRRPGRWQRVEAAKAA